jgi:hypothetical protein
MGLRNLRGHRRRAQPREQHRLQRNPQLHRHFRPVHMRRRWDHRRRLLPARRDQPCQGEIPHANVHCSSSTERTRGGSCCNEPRRAGEASGVNGVLRHPPSLPLRARRGTLGAPIPARHRPEVVGGRRRRIHGGRPPGPTGPCASEAWAGGCGRPWPPRSWTWGCSRRSSRGRRCRP